MNILLVGASGFVGQNLTAGLTRAGNTVRPVSRRHGVDLSAMCSPPDWHGLLDGVDAVINAAGIIGEHRGQRFDVLHTAAPLALFRACEQLGVRRVVQISALGADGTALSAFHRTKRAADDGLLQLDLDAVVVRPSLVYGPGGRSASMLMGLSTWPFIPVLETGQQWLQPVHISDVVAVVLRGLSHNPAQRVLDVVGPCTLTFADWMQTLRQAQGRAAGRLWHVPYRLALSMAWFGQALDPLLAPDNVRMLRAGYRANGKPVEDFLGRPLLSPNAALLFRDASILWSAP
jgi:uncharacterized protein YbjT (DUF2867 family)